MSNLQRSNRIFRNLCTQSRQFSISSRLPNRLVRPRLQVLQHHQTRDAYAKPILRPLTATRYNSSLTVPDLEQKSAPVKETPPSYQLTFTCKPCGHRSAHIVSKQGYHHGTVLITCSNCKNRHVISDHLKIFMDEKSTLEDILKRTSEDGDLSKLLKKGRLGMRKGNLVANEGEEDIEFWDDGTETTHTTATEKPS